MKLMTIASLLLVLCFVAGCTMVNYGFPTENGYRILTVYTSAKEPKLWLEFYNYWENIGFTDITSPKSPTTLLRQENRLRVSVGQPKDFIGHVTQVLIWVNDIGPVEAQYLGGYYYLHLSTKNKWCNFGAEVSGLTPGIYTIRVQIIWTKEKFPFTNVPNEADHIDRLYGRIKHDPFYIVQ